MMGGVMLEMTSAREARDRAGNGYRADAAIGDLFAGV